MNTENSTRVYEFATYNKPLPRFMKKKGLMKGLITFINLKRVYAVVING
jgi:hypothetical protein